MASHGADQLIVQRLLAAAVCPTQGLDGSGFVVLLQMLFLATA